MPWLLAIVATVTPPARSAGNAVAGARNRYCLAAGVPRSVTAVSRLTTARSAPASTGWIGASVVAGSASRGRTTPSKCTSPPKASVTAVPVAPPAGFGGGAVPDPAGDAPTSGWPSGPAQAGAALEVRARSGAGRMPGSGSAGALAAESARRQCSHDGHGRAGGDPAAGSGVGRARQGGQCGPPLTTSRGRLLTADRARLPRRRLEPRASHADCRGGWGEQPVTVPLWRGSRVPPAGSATGRRSTTRRGRRRGSAAT